jgi:hypothetical protein
VVPKISIIGIDNRSNLKHRKRLSIIILSNIAQPYHNSNVYRCSFTQLSISCFSGSCKKRHRQILREVFNCSLPEKPPFQDDMCSVYTRTFGEPICPGLANGYRSFCEDRRWRELDDCDGTGQCCSYINGNDVDQFNVVFYYFCSYSTLHWTSTQSGARFTNF